MNKIIKRISIYLYIYKEEGNNNEETIEKGDNKGTQGGRTSWIKLHGHKPRG